LVFGIKKPRGNGAVKEMVAREGIEPPILAASSGPSNIDIRRCD